MPRSMPSSDGCPSEHLEHKKQQEMRETAPRGKTYVDSKTAWEEATAEAYPEIAEAYAKAAKEEL